MVLNHRFGITYRSHAQGSSRFLNRPLNMGRTGSTKTSISDHLTPRNNTEARRIQFSRGGTLRSITQSHCVRLRGFTPRKNKFRTHVTKRTGTVVLTLARFVVVSSTCRINRTLAKITCLCMFWEGSRKQQHTMASVRKCYWPPVFHTNCGWRQYKLAMLCRNFTFIHTAAQATVSFFIQYYHLNKGR
jgi:hypothetical protein